MKPISRLPLRFGVLMLALFVALGGTATAARLITSKDIKNGTIKTVDMSPSAKRALKGNRGATGPQGLAGPAGPTGAQGPAGPSTVSAITPVFGSLVVPPGQVDGGFVSCPSGSRAVSGGFFTDSGTVFLSEATDDRTGWLVAVDNTASTTEANLEAAAYCAGAGQAVAASAAPKHLKALKGKPLRKLNARKAAAVK